MRLHRNAALGLGGRRRLVMLIVESESSQRQAGRVVRRVAGHG